MFLRLQSYDLTGHPILQEMERIRSYMRKVSQAECSEDTKASVRLNIEAAQRFIRNGLWQANSRKA